MYGYSSVLLLLGWVLFVYYVDGTDSLGIDSVSLVNSEVMRRLMRLLCGIRLGLYVSMALLTLISYFCMIRCANVAVLFYLVVLS